MATNKIQTGIRFEPELLYKITYVAKQNKRSLNAQLEFLAQQCVKEFESANGQVPLDDEQIYKKYTARLLRGAYIQKHRISRVKKPPLQFVRKTATPPVWGNVHRTLPQ